MCATLVEDVRPEEPAQVPKYLQERELLGWREVLGNVSSSQKTTCHMSLI